MSCHDCLHLRPGRHCSYTGLTVKSPGAGKCDHEEHRRDCDCDACQEKPVFCDWCEAPLDEDQKRFCSKGCADAAQSDHA